MRMDRERNDDANDRLLLLRKEGQNFIDTVYFYTFICNYIHTQLTEYTSTKMCLYFAHCRQNTGRQTEITLKCWFANKIVRNYCCMTSERFPVYLCM